MKTHVFKFDSWFMNNDEDWDADFYFLVIVDGKIDFMNAGCPAYDTSMREAYPDRIEHEVGLSSHRGHLECSAGTDLLMLEYPDIWKTLDNWCSFKDRRINR